MTHTVTTEEAIAIQIMPKSIAEEVLQNIRMILSTFQNTVPLDRQFGLSANFIDKPAAVAEAFLYAEVFDALEEYEPRAELVDISITRDDMNGKITPRLEVKIHGE